MYRQPKIQQTPVKLGPVLLPSAYTFSKMHMKGYHSINNINDKKNTTWSCSSNVNNALVKQIDI